MSTRAVLVSAGLSSATAYAILAWISRPDSHPPLSAFFACLAVSIVCWLLAIRRAAREEVGSIWIIWMFALLFRAIGFAGAPLYEDDYFRYLWDGYRFAVAGSPYGQAPAEFFGNPDLPPHMEEVLGGVNFPEIPTIYGPVCQLSFVLAWAIAPGDLWPLKLLFLLVDVALCGLVWSIRWRAGDLLLYAWCPLVVKEIAFTAHTDVLAAALLFLGWALLQRGRVLFAAAALGAAVAAKITILFVAPFLLWQAGIRAWTVAALTAGAFYAPFALQGATDLDGLRAFGESWEFNSFGFALVKVVAGDAVARPLCLVLYAAFALFAAVRRRMWLRPDILLAAFFILAPVVNPWYLLLAAPFVAVFPTGVGLAALCAVFLSYITAGNAGFTGGQFDHPVWVRWAQAAVVAAAALWGGRRQRAAP